MGLQEAGQGSDQFLVVALAFVSSRFDAGQHLPDGIHHREQRSGQLWMQTELSVPQPREQALTHMGNGFQFAEAEESRRALDASTCTEVACELTSSMYIELWYTS